MYKNLTAYADANDIDLCAKMTRDPCSAKKTSRPVKLLVVFFALFASVVGACMVFGGEQSRNKAISSIAADDYIDDMRRLTGGRR